MKFETKCLHAGYSPKNGEPRVQPIVQSTTYTYDSAEEIGKLFDLQAAGYFYTRLANPTTNAAEEKITALEDGVATMCTASGQSAVFYAMLNILEAGDHFISFYRADSSAHKPGTGLGLALTQHFKMARSRTAFLFGVQGTLLRP